MIKDPSGTPPNLWASFCPNLSSRHPRPMTHTTTCTLITERPEKVHSTGSGPAWDSWSLNIWTSGAGGSLGSCTWVHSVPDMGTAGPHVHLGCGLGFIPISQMRTRRHRRVKHPRIPGLYVSAPPSLHDNLRSWKPFAKKGALPAFAGVSETFVKRLLPEHFSPFSHVPRQLKSAALSRS